jgi:hypothetical protein
MGRPATSEQLSGAFFICSASPVTDNGRSQRYGATVESPARTFSALAFGGHSMTPGGVVECFLDWSARVPSFNNQLFVDDSRARKRALHPLRLQGPI